ncbi:hypothetical protein [Cellulomonas chengniuliangii]|uniref:hypothetical protein n=1 Tax=Cellulomonas chengniuliangii TaxID=2968084 RepID=UPI001D0DF902|nr:hypothetical protein [Cellulomonas chengniuliangii]MCC2318521.1 hypothetical protein [Cellulomonas chengniuliangii]
MEPVQMWLGIAPSVAFLVLASLALRASWRCAAGARVRWLVGIVSVPLVLACWMVTAAPQQVETANGVVTCIEEPMFGMSARSQLSSPGCVRVNRWVTGVSLAGAAGVVAAGVMVLRAAERRSRVRTG